MIMDSKHIPRTLEHNGSTISDPTPRHPLPPQLFNDSEYCGDYDDFDLANEIDNLEVFLKLEAPKPVEVSPADEQQQKNGQNEPEEGGDQVTATEEADDENKENKTEEGANESMLLSKSRRKMSLWKTKRIRSRRCQQSRKDKKRVKAICEPSPDGDMAKEVPSKDTVEEVELDEQDDDGSKLEQSSETAEEPLEKIDEDHDENSQQIREELIEKDEESVEKIEEDHHDDDSEEVVTVERTDEDEAEKLEGAKDPPEESSPQQEDIVDPEVDETSEDSESGDDDDEDINSIKEVLKDDAGDTNQVVVDEEDGLVEEMLERDPESEEAVEGKANFSTTDADEEDAEQRELLEAAAAMGKREDETEETAVGGAQAEEEEEDVEIAEQEVSSRNVDV
ncbi:hypothetical protein pipiens_014351 [Culex pipiens pipiens]|uniref:Uncharacterized protein n=1 Tax=Culex pipiens pipiens TaxID=38569 RepID=A0ABD1CV03_CULPP